MANAPIVQRPSYGYFMAKVAPARRPAVAKEIGEVVVLDWQTKVKAAVEAMGFQKPPPAERWRIYVFGAPARDIPPFDDDRWAELALKFPDYYVELRADYEGLLLRAVDGDFDDTRS